MRKKIIAYDNFKNFASMLHLTGKRIVFTNGCYDMYHTGHARSFVEAKKQGQILVVGVNSDKSLREYKGRMPLMHQKERAEMVAYHEAVDVVVIFDDDPLQILKWLRPAVWVKGGDYTLDTVNQKQKKFVESYGGTVYLTKMAKTRATQVIKWLKNKHYHREQGGKNGK